MPSPLGIPYLDGAAPAHTIDDQTNEAIDAIDGLIGGISPSGDASDIAVTPAGAISSTNVQDALQELDAEKAATSAIPTTEQIQDIVGALLVAGANITLSYNDPANTLTVAVAGLTETVQDVVGSFVTAGTGISVAYDDTANTLTVAVSGLTAADVAGLTEAAQDAVGAALTDTATLDLVYDDTANQIKGNVLDSPTVAGVTAAQLRDRSTHTGSQAATTISDFAEAVDDRVAGLLVAGANIGLAYNDAAGTLTVSVSGLTSAEISDFAEAVRDRLGATLAAGPGISLTVDDPGDTVTVTAEVTQAELDAEATARTTADNLRLLKAGDTMTGGLVLDTAGAAGAVDGYRGMLVVKPPTNDEEVVGIVVKVPDSSWGVGQDYGEGNFLVFVSDADNTVPSPTNILKTISATTNASPVAVTTSTAHGFSTGDLVRITGTGIAALDDKWWKVTVSSTTAFTLDGSTAPGSTASAGSAFSDRSATLSRLSTDGWGTGSLHVVPGLRGRAGSSIPTQGVWIDPAADVIGLLISNANTDEWPTTPASDFLRITDVRTSTTVLQVTSAAQLLVDPGSQTEPAFSFVGDPDTGFYRVAADWFGISTGGAIRVDFNTARASYAEGFNIAVGTATGTKIGTATNQKLGFYNATPIVKPTGVAITAAGIHAALVSLGLIAP